MICDGYLESFAGSMDGPVSKAIHILKAYRKEKNQSPDQIPLKRHGSS